MPVFYFSKLCQKHKCLLLHRQSSSFLNKSVLMANLSAGKQKLTPVTLTCVRILVQCEVLV